MKILMVGQVSTGFRFYGPIPDDEDLDFAELEDDCRNDRHDQCFYIEVEPLELKAEILESAE